VVQEVEVEFFSPKTPPRFAPGLECAGGEVFVLTDGLTRVADAVLELAPPPEETGATDGAAGCTLFIVEEVGGATLGAGSLLEDAGTGALLDDAGAGAWLEGGGTLA
jgi:hypothetical protein